MLPIDTEGCGDCHPCDYPREFADRDNGRCIKGIDKKCDCLSRISPDDMDCEVCPTGHVQASMNPFLCILKTPCKGK